MAQSEYLRLERGLRPKQPEEHPPDQVEQVPHRAFIAQFGPSRATHVDRECCVSAIAASSPLGSALRDERIPSVPPPATHETVHGRVASRGRQAGMTPPNAWISVGLCVVCRLSV